MTSEEILTRARALIARWVAGSETDLERLLADVARLCDEVDSERATAGESGTDER